MMAPTHPPSGETQNPWPPPENADGDMSTPKDFALSSPEHHDFDPFDSFDNMEDLMSFGSPSRGISTDLISDLRPSAIDGGFDDGENDPADWRLHNTVNAVHMELQENAKLPTFNWHVDRKGSSQPAESRRYGGRHKNNRDIESSDLPPTVNLTEMFLKTPHRASMNAVYSHAGVLSMDTTTAGFLYGSQTTAMSEARPSILNETQQEIKHSYPHHSLEEEQDKLDELIAEVAPTPLSEICRRHEDYAAHHLPPTTETSSSANISNNSRNSQYYNTYGGRSNQLPIPTKNASPPLTPIAATTDPIKRSCSNTVEEHVRLSTKAVLAASGSTDATISQALATAAAIVSSSEEKAVTPRHQVESSAPSFGVTHRNTLAPDSHGQAHSFPRGAIQHASMQKAQYGFGNNHVIPAVPHPPKHKKISASSTRLKTESPAPSSHASNDGNAGVAYERKKQRAKDARIKLNDAIEKLSVAINLAGTQSKQRLSQWKAAAATSDTVTSSACLDIMVEGMEMAESAKKWDRPSFVGSAAVLIQNLNSQCEALMKELMEVYEHRGINGGVQIEKNSLSSQNRDKCLSAAEPLSTSPTDSKPHLDGPVRTPDCDVLEKRPAKNSTYGDSSDQLNAKRQKTDYTVSLLEPSRSSIACSMRTIDAQSDSSKTNVAQAPTGNSTRVSDSNESYRSSANITYEGNFWDFDSLLGTMASFLDPLSLVRSQLVSRRWNESAIFSKNEYWERLATERFGFYSVRQWRARMEDEDTHVTAPSKTLYRVMDNANVMPHFYHDGMFLLGEARLPGKVSAWTFLVERSNGETLRSVMRNAASQTDGLYTSLPIVELRTVIQNTGVTGEPILIREQIQTVDASTRRRGEEMTEVDWDERFKKRVSELDGTAYQSKTVTTAFAIGELCRLKLFESAVVESYIHARGCSTTSKFLQRANFTKVLVGLSSGVTIPLVIPFPRDATHLHH
jgi:hypothetical protein